jgi:hypothetical protein
MVITKTLFPALGKFNNFNLRYTSTLVKKSKAELASLSYKMISRETTVCDEAAKKQRERVKGIMLDAFVMGGFAELATFWMSKPHWMTLLTITCVTAVTERREIIKYLSLKHQAERPRVPETFDTNSILPDHFRIYSSICSIWEDNSKEIDRNTAYLGLKIIDSILVQRIETNSNPTYTEYLSSRVYQVMEDKVLRKNMLPLNPKQIDQSPSFDFLGFEIQCDIPIQQNSWDLITQRLLEEGFVLTWKKVRSHASQGDRYSILIESVVKDKTEI